MSNRNTQDPLHKHACMKENRFKVWNIVCIIIEGRCGSVKSIMSKESYQNPHCNDESTKILKRVWLCLST